MQRADMNAPLPDFPFTRATAEALGITRHRLQEALRNREVRSVLRGVYVRNDIADTPDLRVRAAGLVMSPHHVLCDRTAAWVHGIDVLQFHELDVLPPLDTYALRGSSRSVRAQYDGGQRDLRPEDICEIDGVRVTTPLRTCMDLGCTRPRWRALAAMDAFMRHHGITREEMWRLLPRYFRRRGVVQLRQLIPIADPRAESVRESRTRLAIEDAGLPRPTLQHWVTVGGRPVFRLDLAYPHAMVAVEYDGRAFHEGDEQVKEDEARRRWLRDRGWTVIVLTKNSFEPEALDAWLNELRVALRQAA
jgi:hypothetical protein